MKKAVILFMTSLIIFSCSKEDTVSENLNSDSELDLSLKNDENISQEVLEKLSFLNFNADNIEIVFDSISKEFNYLIEDDMMISKSYLDGLNIKKGGDKTAHYLSNNVVTVPSSGTREIIIEATKESFLRRGRYRLKNKEMDALESAINILNNLNLKLKFTLKKLPPNRRPNFGLGKIGVIISNNAPSRGGKAQLSSGGDPGRYIYVGRLMSSESFSSIRHMFLHEIGHTIGFQHTDWQNHESCPNSNGENNPFGGTNHISGTPTGYDSTSIMNACRCSCTTGVLNSNDVTALEVIY